MKIQKNHVYLVLGLIALVLVLRWGFGGGGPEAAPGPAAAAGTNADTAPTGPRRITRSIGGGSNRGAANRGPVDSVVMLDLEALDGERVERALTRNPWQYARERPVAPPPRPTPKPQPVERRPAVQPTPTVTAPIEPPRPKPPAIDFKFLGTFGPSNRRIAVFEDGEKILYNASEGDLIKEKFSVAKIGFESVDIAFVGFPDEPTKRLEVGLP